MSKFRKKSQNFMILTFDALLDRLRDRDRDLDGDRLRDRERDLDRDGDRRPRDRERDRPPRLLRDAPAPPLSSQSSLIRIVSLTSSIVVAK